MQMQYEHDDIMSMSCQCEVNHDNVIMTWWSDNVSTNDIMSCQSYVAQMKCEPQ